MMTILAIINGVLDLRPVQYLLLVLVVGFAISAFVFRARVGILTLERDAALGREAQLQAAIRVQNQAVLQANEQAKYRAAKLREAEDRAKLLQIERDKWKKEALAKPLTGTCEDMVDQVLESLQ